MVRVFLCGVGGAGKTTLAEKLMEKRELRRFGRIKEVARKVMQKEDIKKADLESDAQTFLRLQELVMEEQHSEELRCGRDLVSDRSVLDSLTYTYMRRGWNYTEKLMEQKKVIGYKLDVSYQQKSSHVTMSPQDIVESSVALYQHSLVVLVLPWYASTAEE